MRKRILERSEKLFETNLYNVEEYHRAKQRLIRSERLLSSIKNELEQQRNILTAAMYLTSEKCVGGDLVAVGELRPIKPVAEICELEALAVKNRPEAYKAGLDYMNSMNDYNRALTRYLPKVTGFWRTTRDKDKHLYNKDWKDVGMFIYFDLLDWYTNVHEASAARFISEKNRREVGIVALGIASQVRGVALKYMDSLDQVSAADRALQSSEKLLQIQRYKTSRDSLQKLMLEETEADVLQDKIERLRSQGESNSIFAELQSALGTNYSEPFI
jgi:outer membrane protein TolC